MADDEHDRLESWKEIARFIDRDERTAMRWAARGMPVHRVPGGKRGRVFASRAEISQWLSRRESAQPEVETPTWNRSTLRRTYVAAGVLGALALLLYVHVFLSRGVRSAQAAIVTHVTFTSDAVVGWDGGRKLWEHEFPRPLDAALWGPRIKLSDFVRVLDLDHGKKRVVILVVPFRLQPKPDSLVETDVDCFSNRGKLLWSYIPHEKFRFGHNELTGPWFVTTLYVSEIGSEPSLWVAEDHYLWGNSFVVQIDPATGHATLRYINTGVLYALNEMKTARGTYLLAGGFNNEYSAGILAVINEKKPFAVSPQTPGTRHQCVSCAPSVPDEYFIFPRSEVNRVEGIYQDPVTLVQVNGDEIQVHKLESRGLADLSHTIYQFRADPTIRPVSLRYDSSYDMLYRRLEQQGKIHQSLADAPERTHPRPVGVWTSADGWEDYDFHSPGIAAARAQPISRPPRYSESIPPE
jgi:hypothetical protein